MAEIREYSSERDGIFWIATPSKTGSDYGKYFLNDPNSGILCKEEYYPRGEVTVWHHHTNAHGSYVLEGTYHTSKGDFPAGTLVWYRAGVLAEHGATENEDVRLFFMTAGSFDLTYDGPQENVIYQDDDIIAINIADVEWKKVENENGTCYIKPLLDDKRTGMHISVRKYMAGWEEGWHTNSCSCGFYMLKGIAKTQGGFCGPGSFVWEPEGIVTRFGASKNTDALMVYVANGEENPKPAMDPMKWDFA